MKSLKKSLSAVAFAGGLIATFGAGVLLSPSAGAQPADADAAITAHYEEKGGASTPLGEKAGAVYAFGPDGAAQDYRGGKIVYSPETGAKVMYGAILDKYLALGGASTDIGYPVNDESDAPVAGTARYSEFSAADGATIQWSPQNGAWLVRGPIRTAWSHLKATDGPLGSPTSDTTVADGVYTQTFSGQNGNPVQIRWSKADGFTTVPPEIAGQLSGLDVSAPGAAPGSVVSGGNPEPATEAKSDSDSGSSSNAKWWALPIGLVIAAIAGALAAMVGRGGSNHSASGRGRGTPVAAGTAAAARPRGGSHVATPEEAHTRMGTTRNP